MSKHPSDLSAQTAFIGKTVDDFRWKKEKRRKFARKVEIDETIDSPCCVRCRNWQAPETDDEFGNCQKLITIMANAPGSPERGYTAGIEDALANPTWVWQFMRTRPSFAACSRYNAIHVAAATDECEAA